MANNDTRIKELMKTAEAKKTSMGTKPKAAWKTNGIFKYDGSKHINLNTVNDESVLVDALSYMICNRTAQNEAASILGLSQPTIQWDGYGFEDWVADFRLRLSMIKWDKEKKKLDVLETQLKNLISEDAKTEMALDEITKSLS